MKGQKAAAVVALLSCVWLYGRSGAAEEITIGVMAPLTGPAALIGKQAFEGAKIAVEELNGKGGILGKKVALRGFDDACDPGKARAAFNEPQ